MPIKMPVLFIGHGNPMNAIEENEFSLAWQAAAGELPRPRAILCISAHWETNGVQVTAMPAPRTIHDFFGFPQALFDVQYPAPGDPGLAEDVRQMIQGAPVQLDLSWGLDHGAWSVLKPMFPQADAPVVQLSLDRALSPQGHYDLARQLQPLRQQGVLIVGSGNIVHNLRTLVWGEAVFDWAAAYDQQVAQWIVEGNHEAIIHYEKHGQAALLSVNSAEHYLPLLYSLALQEPGDRVSFFAARLWGGSLSMRSVRIG